MLNFSKNFHLLFLFLFSYAIACHDDKGVFVPDPIIRDRLNGKLKGRNREINVLAIDGGGVRGIVPAVILDTIENRSRRSINDLFDLVVGTSTGGILSLGLVVDDQNGSRRSARDMIDIYETMSNEIFPQSCYPVRAFKWLPSWFWKYQYSAKNLEANLDKTLGQKTIKQCTVPTVITSVDIKSNSLKLFKSYRACWCPSENFRVKDVARATSAAPTFFPMAQVQCDHNPTVIFSLVDGGMAANNPAAIALSESFNLYGNNKKINLISIGTGKVSRVNDPQEYAYCLRARPTIDSMFGSQSDTVHKQLTDLCDGGMVGLNYKRLDVMISPEYEEMDKPKNLSSLKILTEDFCKQNLFEISNIVDTLNNNLGE